MYKNQWIPADNPPKTDNYILLSCENFSVPVVGRYEVNDNVGAYYIGDDDTTCESYGLSVNAWMPLPKPYRGEEENETDTEISGK
jgi:hypothetical protein